MVEKAIKIISYLLLFLGLISGSVLMLTPKKVRYSFGIVREYSREHIIYGIGIIIASILIYGILNLIRKDFLKTKRINNIEK